MQKCVTVLLLIFRWPIKVLFVLTIVIFNDEAVAKKDAVPTTSTRSKFCAPITHIKFC